MKNTFHKIQKAAQKLLNIHIYSMRSFLVPLSLGLVMVFAGALFIPQTVSAAALVKPANNLGLVGYWSFNEGTGTTAADFSGNGTNMTIIDGSPTWVDGKNGKALGLLASDDVFYGNASGPINTLSNNFTISTWVKLSNTSQTNKYVFGKLNNAGTNNMFAILYGYSTNAFEFFCGSGCATGYPGTATRISVTDTSWHNITYTYDGTTFRGYLDGVAAITPINVSFSLTSSTNQVVFGDFTVANCCNLLGSIDETRVYNRVLSSTQVISLYNTGAQKLKTGASNNGLVGYWSFNEGTSTKALDFSGYGNTGTLTNMSAPATATSGWGNGKLGGGLNFDGVNDLVDTGDNTSLDFGSGDFTVSAWIYNTSQTNTDTIIGKDSSVGRQFIISMNANSAGGLSPGRISGSVFASNAPSYYGIGTAAGAVSPNQWHHIVYRRVSGVQSLWLDNVNMSVTPVTGGGGTPGLTVQSTVTTMQIGARSYTSFYDFFAGKIDEVRIYNRALSEAEIAGLYTSGAQKINASQNVTGSSLDSGLVGLWSFNGPDVNATTVFDRSGNGNNGTRTNGTTLAQGKVGQGLSFDGVDDTVSVPDSSSWNFSSNDFTVSWWEYRTSNANGKASIVRDTAHPVYVPYLFGYSANGSDLLIYISSSGSSWDVASGKTLGPVTLNTWNHFVVRRSGNNFYAYKNGAQTDTWSSASAIWSVNYPLSLGGGYANSYFYNGSLDDVRVYNRALSASEVTALYNLGK